MQKHVTAASSQARQELVDVVERLIAEFPEQPAGVVIAQVVLARERQRREHRRSGPDPVAAVERAARRRIAMARPA